MLTGTVQASLTIEAYLQRELGLDAWYWASDLPVRDRLPGLDVHVRSETVLLADAECPHRECRGLEASIQGEERAKKGTRTLRCAVWCRLDVRVQMMARVTTSLVLFSETAA
jgi:hypothetical protein